MVMQLLASLLLLAAAYSPFTLACGDDHAHDHGHAHALSKRASSAPIAPPSRPLVWGDFNVIHTTDSHGWLLGHQKASAPEPNYSGDFGDFASFVTHMKKLALEKNVDLLLVDSGDLHDGTGLSDGYPSGGIDAHDSNQFIKKLPYDVLAIGNHELYIYANTLDMHTDFAPHWNGRYLSSNANITIADPHAAPGSNKTVSVPVGSRFAKFTTRLGRRITSLGVLYDFTGNDKNTTVQKVEDMVNEEWFKEAIKEQPDVFLLVGHMPVQKDNWPLVFDAIRAIHPTTPILIFGGHSHIRDCVQLDGRSMSLESGRYMETVGWMSVDLEKSKHDNKNLTITRRYLDPNRLTYEYHTGQKGLFFDTPVGKSISKGMDQLASKFDLSFTFGTAPHDFVLSRAPYPSDSSLLSLFIEQAAPLALALNNSRAQSGVPSLMIINSGCQRFDVFAGSFTKNDQLTGSPFKNAFMYIPDMKYGVAKGVLGALNGEGAQEKRRWEGDEEWDWEKKMYGRGEVETRYNAWLEEMALRGTIERRSTENLTLGYVTSDSCPGVGDDTLHTPLPFYSTPDFIGSQLNLNSNSTVTNATIADATPVDLVFTDFIETQVLQIVNTIQTDKVYSTADVKSYSSVLTNAVLGLYAQEAWTST